MRNLNPDFDIKGSSPAINGVKLLIETYAPWDISVLITGEKGTGKELVARQMHNRSGRKGNFVAQNCGGVPEGLAPTLFYGHRKGAFTDARDDKPGLFLLAENGTLFLDEAEAMPLSIQPVLLRPLDGYGIRPIGSTAEIYPNFRVVAATNQELTPDGFRSDLLDRLDGFRIHMPPLREIREDIPEIVEFYLEQMRRNYGRRKQFTSDALSLLKNHDFPGNTRQLINVVKYAYFGSNMHDFIGADLVERRLFGKTAVEVPEKDAPAYEPGRVVPVTGNGEVRDRIAAIQNPREREIVEALLRHGGRMRDVAAEMHITYQGLYGRIRALGYPGTEELYVKHEIPNYRTRTSKAPPGVRVEVRQRSSHVM
ncbi:MAG: sigma-54-dependent Fis family transcriptional regulator [Candidatus Aenigmarchaeota archaeon]|nr:sigma-54-dependent Fis family transcriptional regulator [Candidatus Aenigmarchaeota archaeon]